MGYEAEMMTEFFPVLILILIVILGLIVLYYVLVIRAILDMLRRDVNVVLLVFAFISLVFTPFTLILGIGMLIIWHFHKKDIQQSEVN